MFSQRGFLSIVECKNNPDLLLVRARAKGDIEAYWPTAYVREGEGTDYRFRSYIPRDQVANRLAKIVREINYPDFKASLRDRKRIPWYSRVWANMSAMQDALQKKEDTDGSK